MDKVTLVVMAAGMGSRFGGCKQISPVGPNGEILLDFSVYDAIAAGFTKVVFVIKHAIEEDFKAMVGKRIAKRVKVEYVYQDTSILPEGRKKPFGTGHAVLCCMGKVNEPFAVINADDFYGHNTFEVMAQELMRPRERKGDYCMVGFKVGNTMSEGGKVSRGVCSTKNGLLATITERTSIGYNAKGQIIYDDEHGNKQKLNPNTPVSMNMWGFTPDYFDYSQQFFVEFLEQNIDNLKAEYFIPTIVNRLITSGEATVKVMETNSKWFGVTYPEDRPTVIAKLAALHAEGAYPERLFN